MATKKGLSAAGIGELQTEGHPPVWSTYFAVSNADATAAKVKDAGGRVLLEPFDVTDAGRMAIVSDPTGAVFGIWQAGNHFGAAIVNEHGALNWNELLTDDTEKALAFYQEVFGHEIEVSTSLTGSDYFLIKVGDRGLPVPWRSRWPRFQTIGVSTSQLTTWQRQSCRPQKTAGHSFTDRRRSRRSVRSPVLSILTDPTSP